MDIHPPEHPIRSVRDFALQIFTVTCGILIALGLEGLVVDHREARLRQETRAEFQAEIGENLDTLQQTHAAAPGVQAWLEGAMAYGDARLKHGATSKLTPVGKRRFPTLPHAAWDTALATQAMPLLTFSEARLLAKAYNAVGALNDITAHARDHWFGVARFGDLDDLSDAEIREGMGELRIDYGYMVSIDYAQTQLADALRNARTAIAQASPSE